MRKVFWIVTLALFLLAQSALATSVAGKWSGTMTVDGKRYSTSVRFSSGGSFSARANGISVSGKYSVSGNTIRLRAWGVSISLMLREKSGRQTLSGSASQFGRDGSITLSRKKPSDERREEAEISRIAGAWTLEAGGRFYSMKLYETGFAHWSEGPVGGEPDAELYAKMTVRGERLMLKPLDGANFTADVPGLKAWLAEGAGIYDIPYVLKDELLMLPDLSGFDQCDEALDAKPSDAYFLPYLNLQKGDRGQAVVWLQQRLINLGFLACEADGVFGRETLTALKRFQAANSLAQDGIAGPDVMARLAP